jgi:single-strand DNA-binding protein
MPEPARSRSSALSARTDAAPLRIHRLAFEPRPHSPGAIAGARTSRRHTLCAEVICVEQTEALEALNDVVLRGRISGDPQTRELPSGSVLVAFRLVLPRDRSPITASSKQVSDWVECTAWCSRVRKQAETWHDGDHVEVRGALRRRHFRVGEQSRTSLEVEMLSGRRVRRAPKRRQESLRAVNG